MQHAKTRAVMVAPPELVAVLAREPAPEVLQAGGTLGARRSAYSMAPKHATCRQACNMQTDERSAHPWNLQVDVRADVEVQDVASQARVCSVKVSFNVAFK